MRPSKKLLIPAAALLVLGTWAHWLPADPPATTGPTTAPAPVEITWDQAAQHVNETATVSGPVMGTHVSGDKKHLSLNVGKDYPDTSRFTVRIPYDEAAGSPDDLYKGKTVTVTGKITLYRNSAEISAEAKDLTVKK